MKEESKFYSLKPALSRGCEMIFVIGGRAAGKTYAFKEWAITDFLKNGNEWVYLRRGRDEIQSIKAVFWDDILYKYGKEVKTVGYRCFIRNIKPLDIIGKDEKEWKQLNEWEPFGYFIAVSEQQNYKSASFPKVNKICYDEFIIENTRKLYLPNEIDQFMGIVSTVFRTRKGKTIALSNSGFINNPFFKYYGIESGDFASKKFIKKNNGNVLFEYYELKDELLEDVNNSSVARISGESYKKYAIDGKFKDGGDEFITEKAKGMEPWVTITADGVEWLTIYTKMGEKWWISTGKPSRRRYCLDKWKPVEKAEYRADINKWIKVQMDARQITFGSADNRETFMNMIRKTRA